MCRKIVTMFLFLLVNVGAFAQCSICTKTAQQLGDGPAHGMNTGIIYLAFMPLAAIGFIGFRWWRNEKKRNETH